MLARQHNMRVESCRSCVARSLGLCGAFSREEIDEIATAKSRKRLTNGEFLFCEGEQNEYFYNIVSGAVKLVKSLPDGRTQVTGFVLSGESAGFSGVEKYACSAQAITSTVVCAWRQEDFLSHFELHSRFRSHFLDLAQRELAAAQDHFLLLGAKTATERVASFLLLELKRTGRRRLGGTNLDLAMGRRDIAEYLGLAVETVCRNFSDLKKLGIINYNRPGRSITVRNRNLLESIAFNGLQEF